MKRTHIFLLTIILFAVSGYLAIYKPWKVTDPADPRFDPDAFSFWDYPMGACAKNDVFEKLFPLGTPKKFVDHILIDVAGGTSWRKEKNIKLYGYWEPRRIIHSKGPPQHTFLFDEEEMVVQIFPCSGNKLYKDQPDKKEYWNEIKNGEEN